jgi:hypothetical protein
MNVMYGRDSKPGLYLVRFVTSGRLERTSCRTVYAVFLVEKCLASTTSVLLATFFRPGLFNDAVSAETIYVG